MSSERRGLLVAGFNTTAVAQDEFNDWYDEEHIPRLSAVAGCLCARRFRTTSAISNGNHRYLALYHLAAPDVCSSPAWKAAAETPWTLKLRPHMNDRMRLVLRRYQRKA